MSMVTMGDEHLQLVSDTGRTGDLMAAGITTYHPAALPVAKLPRDGAQSDCCRRSAPKMDSNEPDYCLRRVDAECRRQSGSFQPRSS
jgi:hypothetical protein